MTTHGTQNHSRLATIDDLDALLAKHALAPAVIKLGGTEFQIRTDLTAKEVATYVELAGKELSTQAFTILVGTKAERTALFKALDQSRGGDAADLPAGRHARALDAILDSLPRMHVALAVGRIMRASRVLAQYAKDEEGILRDYGFEPHETTEAPTEPGESLAS